MPAPAYGDEVSLIGVLNTSLLQPGEVGSFEWSVYYERLVTYGYVAIYTGPIVPPPRPPSFSDASVASLVAASSAATRAAVDARVTAVGNATYATPAAVTSAVTPKLDKTEAAATYATAAAVAAVKAEFWAPELTGTGLFATSSRTGQRGTLDLNSSITNVRSVGDYVTWEQGGSSWFAPGNGSLARMPIATDFTTVCGWGSSTMQGFRTALEAALETRAGLTYHDGGVGGQSGTNVFARLGTRKALINAVTIPASGAVSVVSSNMPSTAPVISITGTLAGIAGTLARSASAWPGQFTFTRTASGSATDVTAGTPFIPDEGPANRASVTILNVGKNDLGGNGYSGYLTTTDLIAETKKAYDYVSGSGKHVLMLGHYVNPNTVAVSDLRRDVLLMNAYYATYGDRFVDLSGYVTGTAIWAATGVTPTSDDLAQQALGNLPPSLSSDGTHMTDAAYTAVVENVIVPRLNKLGWLTVPEVAPVVPTDFLARFTMDYLTGTVSDGAVVSSLANQAGTLSLTMANKPTAGTYPTLQHAGPNGHAALVFPSTDSWLSTVDGSTTAPSIIAEGGARTQIVVVKVRDVAVNAGSFPKIVAAAYSNSPTSYQQIAANLVGTPRLVSAAAGGSAVSTSGTENILGKWAVVVLTEDTSGNTTITSSGAAAATATGQPVGAIKGLRFGAQHGSAPGVTGQLDGSIADYIVYNRVLSEAERTAAITALKSRYAIV